MLSHTHALRAQIVELTTAIGEGAIAGEWDSVSARIRLRQTLLASYCEAQVDRDALQGLADVIRVTDERVARCADQARQATVDELADYRRRNKAAQAYLAQTGA